MRVKKTLSNFAKSLSESAEETVKKSENLVLIAKLNIEIVSKQSSIEDLYAEIGETIYKRYIKGKFSDHDLQDYFKSINKLNKEIKELKKEITSIKCEKTCSSCGHEMDSHVKYCPVCGSKQGK